MTGSRSLRIAVAVHTFPTVTETFVLEPIVHLLENGHEVDILALYRGDSAVVHPAVETQGLMQRTRFLIDDRPGPGRIRKLVRGGQTLLGLPYNGVPWLRVAKDTLQPAVIRRAPELVLAGVGAAAGGSRRRYDIIHAHMGPVALVVQYLRDWDLLKGPLLATFHGSDVLVEPGSQPRGFYQRLFEGATLMTANSNFLRERVIALGASPERVVQAPVGVNVADFSFRERGVQPGERIRVLTVARLNPWKGVEFGIEAIRALVGSGVDVEYTVVGDGPRYAEFEALIRTHGLRDRITLTGGLPWDQVLAAYDSHHLFLLPGIVGPNGGREAQGKVLAEAQACGLPIVATSVGGIPEVVAPGAGRLVEPRDPVALASAVRALIQNPDTWPEMGRRGRAFVERHFDNVDLMAETVERYGLLAEAGPAAPRADQR